MIRGRSPLLAERFPDGSGDEGLAALVLEASSVVSMLTGRMIGVTGEGPWGCPLEEVPLPLQPLAVRAVRLRAERMDLLEMNPALLIARAEQVLGGLASFSAGPYSESYFPPGQTVQTLQALDPDPEHAAELWSLATECVREGWLRLWYPGMAGIFEPTSTNQEFDWFPADPYPYREPWT